MLNRAQQPELMNIEKVPMLEPSFISLSNGIPVYYLNSDEQEVVRLEISFNAGSWYAAKKLVSRFTSLMLTEGSKKYNSAQISELFDSNGAHIDVSADRDYATVSLVCLNKYLNNTIEVLADLILKPTFPTYEFDLLVKNSYQNLLINNKKVGFVARNQFLSLILGPHHPYGRFAQFEDYEKLNTNDLQLFWESNFKISSAKFFLSGKVDRNVLNLVEKHFGNTFQTKTTDLSDFDHQAISHTEHEHFIEIEGSVQNAIRMGFSTISIQHPDLHSLRIVNTILGGYFGSRLMNNIREDKGYTYGIGSGILNLKHESFLFISSEVNAPNTNDTIREIKNEITKLQNELISSEELNLVKNYLSGSFMRNFDGIFSQMDRVKELILNDLPRDYYEIGLQKVHNITKHEILEISQKYFEIYKIYTLVVGTK